MLGRQGHRYVDRETRSARISLGGWNVDEQVLELSTPSGHVRSRLAIGLQAFGPQLAIYQCLEEGRSRDHERPGVRRSRRVYDEVLPFFAELVARSSRSWIPAPACGCSIWVPDAER